MIDTNMLAAMRDAIAELLPDTCHILTVTRTVDGMGGWSESWGTTYANISCRLDAQAMSENLKGAAVQPYKQYMLSLPYDTTVTTANRIKHNGITYAVTGVNTSQSWQAVKRVTLEAV